MKLPDAYGIDPELDYGPYDDNYCKTSALSQNPEKVKEAELMREKRRQEKERNHQCTLWKSWV